MSHNFNPGQNQRDPFVFSNEFQESHSLAEQLTREKARAYEPPASSLVGIEHSAIQSGQVYEPVGMLSEMFTFPDHPRAAAEHPSLHHGFVQHLPDITSESAAAMPLYLLDAHQRRPSSHAEASFGGLWLPNHVPNNALALSLSSPLETGRPGDCAVLYDAGASSSSSHCATSHHMFYKGTTLNPEQIQGLTMNQPRGVHVGYGAASVFSSPTAKVNTIRNSKYLKPAQDLLEEFCSVGIGNTTRDVSKENPSSNNDTRNLSSSPPLSASDKILHQRRRAELVSLLDEVERRYSEYCEQMQSVVNSLDMAVGEGAALPYTLLAQKAMSRHFRSIKDTIAKQVKQSCELMGEKDTSGGCGITKGETPRLRLVEQSLRQQRPFHQMGIMEQDAWRPQRGLPERSVNILRAWLFEHFLHPYPTDADKHLLARRTGLSRNQVSNWFINARVRLWKPMVEDMYQHEANEEDDESSSDVKLPPTGDSPDDATRRMETYEPLMLRYAASGDVSLTLGLRHEGNGAGRDATPPFQARRLGLDG